MNPRKTSDNHSAKRVLRRVLPAALVLFAVCLVLMTPAAAAGIDITGSTASGAGWSYDADNQTLTLNGGTWDYINVTGVSDLTIVLNGKNTISGGNSITEYSDLVMYGIYVAGNLTIQDGGSGSGSVTVNNVTAKSTSSDTDAYGLYAGTITIESGSVKVSSVNATSDSDNAEAFGLYAASSSAGTISISGGSVKVSSVNATSDSDSAKASGLYATNYDITVSSGSVEVDGVRATSDSDNAYAYGLIAGNITIEIGSVEVDGVRATSDSDSAKAFGLTAASYSAGTISITDGSVSVNNVTAESDSSDADAYGLAAADTISISSGSVSVSDVTATSTSTSSSDNADAYGLYAASDSYSVGTISISGGSVTVSSVTAESTSSSDYARAYGLIAYNDITVSGGSVTVSGVVATSTSSGAYAYGLIAGTTITVSGGSVTVSGVTATSTSSGAYAYGLVAATISITGGQTLATGSTQALYAYSYSSPFTVDSSLAIWAMVMNPTELTKIENAANVISNDPTYKYVFITVENTAPTLYTVTFNANGGTPTPSPQILPSGVKAVKPADPTRDGYTFDGWFKDSDTTEYEFSAQVTADITLTAHWEGGTPDDTTPDDNDSDDNDSDDNDSDDNNQNNSAPGIVDTSSSGNAVDTGSGKYSEYPRTVKDGGSVSFGTSPVASEVILPKGSTGSVVLKVASIEDWPGKEKTPYAFDISVPGKAEGVAQIIFKIKLSELERLEVLPKDVGTFHNVGEEWVQLKTVYEIKDEYVWYTAETDSFSPFEIRFVEDGTVPKDSAEPVAPVVPETPETPVTPDEPEILPPIDPVVPETPDEPESPAPILAVLAGLGAAVVLRRK